MDNDVVEAMTDKILGKAPNTYAFTKALSESLVEESMPHIPSIILRYQRLTEGMHEFCALSLSPIKNKHLWRSISAVRPSIIIPIWKEPLPGWTDNINGPTGLLIGAGKGVIRTMYCDKSHYADFVPVDIAVNAILVTTCNFIYFKDQDKRVYNLTSSNEFKVRKSNLRTWSYETPWREKALHLIEHMLDVSGKVVDGISNNQITDDINNNHDGHDESSIWMKRVVKDGEKWEKLFPRINKHSSWMFVYSRRLVDCNCKKIMMSL